MGAPAGRKIGRNNFYYRWIKPHRGDRFFRYILCFILSPLWGFVAFEFLVSTNLPPLRGLRAKARKAGMIIEKLRAENAKPRRGDIIGNQPAMVVGQRCNNGESGLT